MSLLDKTSLLITPNAVKASKLYSVIPSDGTGDLTVVRNTIATRVNSLGLIESVSANVPRLNYDSLGGNPSVLLEPQKTNLITFSEEIDSGVWAKGNAAVLINNGIAPDGFLLADRVNGTNTSSNTFRLSRNNLNLSSGIYNLSFYVRNNNSLGTIVVVFLDNVNNNISEIFSITNNTLSDWTRLSVNLNTSTAGLNNLNQIRFDFRTVSGNITTLENIEFWGAQLETGDVSSYIPTTNAAVTRNADLISKTGISDLIGQTEGVIFLEIQALFDDNVFSLISLRNSTLRDRLTIGYNNSAGKLYIEYKANNIIRFSNTFNIVKTDNNKIAVRYKSGEQTLFLNGTKTSIGTTPALFTNLVDELFFSYTDINTFTFKGKLKGLQLYKTALTDAECVSLTTL